MPRPKFVVQHFVACPAVDIARVAAGNPYTLRDVTYDFEAPADAEWPVRLDGLYLFARFFNRIGVREFGIQVKWLDAPNGSAEVCEFTGLRVRFPRGEAVKSWAWNPTATSFPGPGRYVFRLRDGRTGRTPRREYIRIGRAS